MDRDRSVARCVCRTPSDAQETFGKGKEATRDDRGPHAGGVEAVRRVDHTRWRYGRPNLISSFPFHGASREGVCARGPQTSVCADHTPHVSLSRVNHHRAACASVRVDGTAPGVRQDEIGVGHLRGRDTPRASRVQFEDRRTGAPWRRLGEDCEERLGITSASSLFSPFLVGRTEMID